jgi:hypothetical protein
MIRIGYVKLGLEGERKVRFKYITHKEMVWPYLQKMT